jgi:DNA invertase Pin-like site-specific DNA recombinase
VLKSPHFVRVGPKCSHHLLQPCMTDTKLLGPVGRLMVQIIGAMAEFERSLIQERVKAGLRNARAKGKHLGRPKKILDTKRIASLRAKGVGWKRIVAEMGVGTLYRIAQDGSKTREKVFGT